MRRRVCSLDAAAVCNISIHAAREGGDEKRTMSDDTATISIHAAREGSDLAYGVVITRLTISIHAAREDGDAAYKQFMAI